jgi:hypothetical protein
MDWMSMSDEQRSRAQKDPRPSGLRRKWRSGASKISTVAPLRSSLFFFHIAIFSSSALHAVTVHRP